MCPCEISGEDEDIAHYHSKEDENDHSKAEKYRTQARMECRGIHVRSECA